MTAAAIARALPKGHRSKSGAAYVACCPAHEDSTPSLSLRDARDGRPLVHCHAGCTQDAVIAALKELALWPDREQQPGAIEAVYRYTDEAGALMYEIIRKPGKKFQQRYPDDAGGWIWKKHTHQVLYRLPEVIEAPIVFVVEGERDVETLRDHGFVATTNAGGANVRWLDSYTEVLTGRSVIIIPDNDPPGWQRAKKIAQALLGKAAEIIVLDDIHRGGAKDITDWFAAGHSECELIAILEPSFVDQLPGGPI